jgi:hypothetical protein
MAGGEYEFGEKSERKLPEPTTRPQTKTFAAPVATTPDDVDEQKFRERAEAVGSFQNATDNELVAAMEGTGEGSVIDKMLDKLNIPQTKPALRLLHQRVSYAQWDAGTKDPLLKEIDSRLGK